MKKIKWHVIGVIIYITYALILDFLYFKKFYFDIELSTMLLEVWIFYSGYTILYFLFIGPRRIRALFIPMILISLIGSYYAVLLNFLANTFHFNVTYTQKKAIYETSQFYTHFFTYALGYFFVERFIQRQKLLRFSEQKKVEIEKEKLNLAKEKLELENKNLRLQEDLLQSQNDFLRAQINPHFLYNCLNFFYSQTFISHPNVAQGVLTLSDMMRYSLKDYAAAGGLANLNEEIEHIQNIIKMNQLRFSGKLQIQFIVEGDTAGKQVAPMVFITLVENIFKHGELQDSSFPAIICCRINTKNQTVYFSTANKKNKVPDKISTGIGLKNIQQRLSALYKENYVHTRSDQGELYKEELTIPYFEKVERGVVA